MSTEENKALVRQYLGDISGHEKPARLVDRYIADSDQSLKDHIASTEAAFPCYTMIEQSMIAENDQVAVRFMFRGTHQGTYLGVPASGEQIELPGIIIYRIAEGKIVEHWLQIDALSMLQQLGLMPSAR